LGVAAATPYHGGNARHVPADNCHALHCRHLPPADPSQKDFGSGGFLRQARERLISASRPVGCASISVLEFQRIARNLSAL
jgi:hypothetical protein